MVCDKVVKVAMKLTLTMGRCFGMENTIISKPKRIGTMEAAGACTGVVKTTLVCMLLPPAAEILVITTANGAMRRCPWWRTIDSSGSTKANEEPRHWGKSREYDNIKVSP